VYEHFGISDISSHPGARCVALCADGAQPKTMTSVDVSGSLCVSVCVCVCVCVREYGCWNTCMCVCACVNMGAGVCACV